MMKATTDRRGRSLSGRQRQGGLTILELMIVLMIMSILLVIAIPVYQDYAKRMRVSEMINLVGPIKTKVAEHRLTMLEWPADNAAAGLRPPEGYATSEVQSIEIGVDGDIIVTSNVATLEGETMIWSPTFEGHSVSWDCTGGTLPAPFRPQNCRL